MSQEQRRVFIGILDEVRAAAERASMIGAEIDTALKSARSAGASPQEIDMLRAELVKEKLGEAGSRSL